MAGETHNSKTKKDPIADGLGEIGLARGEKVRWQRKAGGHWQVGEVIRREPDGSIAVHDPDGAWRSLPVDRLEVSAGMRRARTIWEPLEKRIERAGQLSLWGQQP